MKEWYKRYYLKTGLAIAIIFPGIFVFDRTGEEVGKVLLVFFTFFSFILILWIYNSVFVDFGKILGTNAHKKYNGVYISILLSLLLSIPLYFAIGIVFRQERILFSSLFDNNFSAKSWFYIILRIVLFDVGLLIVKFMIDNNKEKQRFQLENEILKTEQLRAIHETFKQQVDPHFLFNSLNTLQSLVKQNDSEQTLQFIKELSMVYRYMLTRRDKNFVTIGEEVSFLKSYLYLLKIRFGEALNTIIEIDDNHLTTEMPVHTLQLLAENAVKHNVVGVKQPLVIRIKSHNNHLVVTNNLSPKQHAAESSGIGLQNINNRYLLLYGKEISITSNNGDFTVLLPIIDSNENTNYRG
jgi:two-component system LytT family sensor kinase